MLNVSTAPSTLSPRGAPAPGKIAGGDFKDALDGLGTIPAAEALLAIPAATLAPPAVSVAIPAPPATVALPAAVPVADLPATTPPAAAPPVTAPPVTEQPVAGLPIAELPVAGPSVPAPPVPEAPTVPPPVAKLPGTILADPARPPACMIEPVTGRTAGAPDLTMSLLPAMPIGRQTLADDGKRLPADLPDDDPSADIIWLPSAPVLPAPVAIAPPPTPPEPAAAIAPAVTALVVATPVVTTPFVTTPVAPPAAAAPIVLPSAGDDTGVAALAAPPTQAVARSDDAPAPALPAPTAAPVPASAEAPAPAPAIAAGVVTNAIPAVVVNGGAPAVRLGDTVKPDLPVRFAGLTATAQPAPPQPGQPQPSQSPPQSFAILPAGQVFAAAIAAAVRQGRDAREADETRTPLAIATAALDRLHAPAIAAPADARQTALDLRQDSGLQGMIDHIEVLRDGANAGDTRIRLVPDALGAVDVSVRRDGDRVHVHFNAETPASARLIAEAQPRLAELADARGVKLGQTSVDSGDGQARRQQPATPIQFTRPAAAGDSPDTRDDIRVA